MVYQPLFYKLLGIPKTVAEPTPYHLLGITPQVFSPELVESSRRERKRMLRQNVPGPQFIPIVSLFEKELDAAADILLDPGKRKALHERLIREIRDKKLKKAKAKREREEKTAQKLIRSAVARDGTLADSKRDALAERLAKLGLESERVKSVLLNIPRPAAKAETTPGALEYFADAVDSAIIRNVLTEDDERELKKLAGKLKIPTDQAIETILRRLKAKGAQRGKLRSALLKAQFDERVRSAMAKGPLTQARRDLLLKLAATQGLSPALAEEVIEKHAALAPPPQAEEHVPAPADQPTGRKALGLAIAAELDGHAEAESARIAAEERAAAETIADVVEVLNLPTDRPKRKALARACKIGIPIVAIATFWLLVIRYGSGSRPAEEGPVPKPAAPPPPRHDVAKPAGGPVIPNEVAALITSLLKPANSQDDITAIVGRAAPSHVHAALAFAVDQLRQGPTSLGASLAERLCRHLTTVPLDARAQDIVIQGLIRAARSGREPSRASRLAGILSSALFLRASASGPESAAARDRLLDQCEKAWAQSQTSKPDDPLGDAQRLVNAVAAGADLAAYASRAEAKQFGELADVLAQVAADPSREGARQASESLIALATGSHTTGKLAEARKAAQLALCKMLRHTRDFATASTAYAALGRATQAKLQPRPPSLATTKGRQELAQELERLVKTGSRVPAATYAARTARPTTSAERIRDAYCTAPNADTNAMLCDIALTMLAFCDRAMLFAAGDSTCSSELAAMAGAADRAQRIANKVTLPSLSAAARPTAAPAQAKKALSATRLEELKQKLQSSKGRQYSAIEELRVADTPAAAKVLLDELAARIRSQSEFQGPSPETATACRVLRALGSMSDPSLPGALASMIAEPGNPFYAHAISRTLANAYGVDSRQRRRLVVPPLSSEGEQRLCHIQWQRLTQRSPWRQSQPAWLSAAAASAAQVSYPEPPKLKLLAAAAHYAEYAAEALKVCHWQEAARASRSQLLPMTTSIVAPDNVGASLLAAADAIVGQLARLVREHPKGAKCGTKADMVELEKKARLLASDTALQKVAVCLDAAGGMLALLVEELDETGAHKAKLASVREARRAASRRAADVLHEIRDSGYHGLLLWDIVLVPD